MVALVAGQSTDVIAGRDKLLAIGGVSIHVAGFGSDVTSDDVAELATPDAGTTTGISAFEERPSAAYAASKLFCTGSIVRLSPIRLFLVMLSCFFDIFFL